ncbi:DUF1810 domain-containing protein [Metarhizobium album]|uniref:DUF1810 domain-containing protein n=1 Tax=Metarhizobium album TaxID=2182425 RepID=A0A2U2DKM7_9HYPH|nr:DUF1810 domain-containing protein [Rhizobium album]PWE53854.1 DUF1810 domain-containing protein [Rhizobium album]
MATTFDLDRFMAAQEGVHKRVIAELRAGAKQSHWIWFIFPQMQGLGSSPTARKFAIRSKDEAVAYVRHAVLGPRLKEAVQAMLDIKGKSALEILGSPDDLKFRSSMTLFAAVCGAGSIFHQALDRFYDGAADERTLALIDVAVV